jgi:polysaccharide chain length determinant protein (PEP-CTERM system associated)
MKNLPDQSKINIEQIIGAALRYKWIIIISLCIFLTAGLGKTLTSDRIYEANTLILVQPQKVPKDFVRSVVSTGIESRISTISQQIMSRSNLEKIINQFGLFADNRDMYLEDKIADLRQRIVVDTTTARHGSEAFSIKFKGNDPEKVMRITNTLAGYFMDENLKVREAQAIGTSNFLEVELEKTRKKLEQREQRLADYRSKHLGGLPSELESNLRTLDRLQKQLESRQISLNEIKSSLAMLEKQESDQNNLQDSFFSENYEDDQSFVSGEDEVKLERFETELENLLLRYTEKHPDVQKLNVKIDKLRQKIQNSNSEEGSEPSSPGNEFSGAELAKMQFGMQKDLLLNEIKKHQQDIKKIEADMALYQKRVEQTPEREQELQSLQRDYQNIQKIYNSLLDRKLEAEISVNMEKKQKGEQFRILDHARRPQKPVSPDVNKNFILFTGAGIFAAGGICFLLFIFDNSIRRNEDIEEFNIPVLAEIAPIKTPKDYLIKKISIGSFVFLISYTLIVISVFGVMKSWGIDRTLDFINSYLT